MKELLIIRSVSFQQLDLNLKVIKEKYSDFNISILTHEHGIKLAQKYTDIKNIYVYPYKEGFKISNKVKELENKKFDVVIIPVTNISGAGFFNVLRFSKSIKAKKRIMCNVISDLKEITDSYILYMQFRNLIFEITAGFFSLIMGLFILFFLPLKLRSLLKK